MSAARLVLVPRQQRPESLPATVSAVAYANGAELLGGILSGSCDGAVVFSDLLLPGQTDAVAAALRATAVPAIEVRSARWDGETQSALSAACRGVISGFGEAGIAAALVVLSDDGPG